MKTAFSLMLARHDDGTHRAAARAEVAGARRLRWGSNSSACGAVEYEDMLRAVVRRFDEGSGWMRLGDTSLQVNVALKNAWSCKK